VQSANRARDQGLFFAALLTVCAIPTLWPLDTSFVNDEPALIGLALQHNARGDLAELGLRGSRGARYGPIAIWVYQGLLAVTHDPASLVRIHAFMFMAVTAVGLLWLGRSLALPKWWAVAVLLSPYLWHYSRMLWDNTLCIPLSALSLAAYASFVVRPKPAPLALALAGLVACTMVHLMALALALPVVAHLLLTRGSFLLRTRLLPLVPALLVASLGFRFWLELLDLEPAKAALGPEPRALWFASFGGRLLTAGGLDYFFGQVWTARWLGGRGAAPATAASLLLGHGLVWGGMLRSMAWVRASLRNEIVRSPRLELATVALGVWLTQTALNLATRTAHHPHYYNATWIVFVLFAWFALERLSRSRLGVYALPLHAAALFFVLVLVIAGVHESRGSRTLHYGMAMGEQLRVVSLLTRSHPHSRITTDIEQLRSYPQALTVLLWLAPLRPSPLQPRRLLHVTYASKDPAVAALRVRAELSGPRGP
jgi:hypothetical protein